MVATSIVIILNSSFKICWALQEKSNSLPEAGSSCAGFCPSGITPSFITGFNVGKAARLKKKKENRSENKTSRKSTWLFSACYLVAFIGYVLNILMLAGEEAQQRKKEVTIMVVAIWPLGFDDWHY